MPWATPVPRVSGCCAVARWQHSDYALHLELSFARGRPACAASGGSGNRVAEPCVRRLACSAVALSHQRLFTVGRSMASCCFTYRGAIARLLRVDHCGILHPAINATLEVLQGPAEQSRPTSPTRCRVGSAPIRVAAGVAHLARSGPRGRLGPAVFSKRTCSASVFVSSRRRSQVNTGAASCGPARRHTEPDATTAAERRQHGGCRRCW